MPLFTPEALLSHPHLAKAQPPQDENGKPKFGGTFVFAKKNKAALAELEAAAREVVVKALGEAKGKAFKLYGGKGSAFRDDQDEKYPSIEGGVITIGARNDKQPGLVYRHADPATIGEGKTPKPERVPQEKIEEVFYPGAVVLADIKPYWYDKGVNKGIGWALNNVQKRAEGERLDGRMKAEDAFQADMSEVPAGLEDLVGKS